MLVNYCPYLLFHSQSNKIFVYDSTQISAMSLDDKIIVKVDLPFIEEEKTISSMMIDKMRHIYIVSDSIIFKCIYQSELHLVECLGKIDLSMSYSQMIVTSQGNEFYFSDMDLGYIYRSTK
jgi:hypothetical protein